MVKYLKLIVKEQLHPGLHVTFAYFGTELVDTKMIDEELETVKPFTLGYSGEENLGSEQFPLNASMYKASPEAEGATNARIAILGAAGYEVVRQNYGKWNPHVTNKLGHKMPQVLHVLGVQSNDGEYKKMFTD